jgi:hypothetical protein
LGLKVLFHQQNQIVTFIGFLKKRVKLVEQKIITMLKFNEIKVGDFLVADNDGDPKSGEVTNLNGNEKQVCVDTGAQEFWYEMNQLSGLPITDDQLMELKFHKEVTEDGKVKYSKGAFRMFTPGVGDFSKLEIWYRDEHRHIYEPIQLHHLQNHFYEMTKVHLNRDSFDA